MKIAELFTDAKLVERIQTRLPRLFALAELESSRAGKVGMEVGSVREKILIALLIYKFGAENVETNIPITEPEIDVRVCGEPASIKTITRNELSGVKLIWTVDAQQALHFTKTYVPRCDMLLVQVNWNRPGWMYLFSRDSQIDVLNKMGQANYFKLPKLGTNPRGVEISPDALHLLVSHPQSKSIPVFWQKTKIDYNPYQRWLEFWQRD